MNHLTQLSPGKAECRFGAARNRSDGALEVDFTMHPQSLTEGKPREIKGTLVLPQSVAVPFYQMLTPPQG